jgi:hypothetical protein
MQASVVAEAGSGKGSAASEEAAGSGSDSGLETDWEEMGPSLQDFDDWPDAPVMMCPDPADRQQVGCLAVLQQQQFLTEGGSATGQRAAHQASCGSKNPFSSELHDSKLHHCHDMYLFALSLCGLLLLTASSCW